MNKVQLKKELDEVDLDVEFDLSYIKVRTVVNGSILVSNGAILEIMEDVGPGNIIFTYSPKRGKTKIFHCKSDEIHWVVKDLLGKKR
jgi:hypothetical protein